MGQQEIHLVGQDPFALQIDKLGMIRGEWDRQEPHAGVFRAAVGLGVVTPFTGANNIVPAIGATIAQGRDMISRKIAGLKLKATIQAQILVALE